MKTNDMFLLLILACSLACSSSKNTITVNKYKLDTYMEHNFNQNVHDIKRSDGSTKKSQVGIPLYLPINQEVKNP
jgi:hypothetical protein